MVADRLKRFNDIYRTFRSVSDNTHGNVEGVSGSLTPGSFFRIFKVADVFGSNYVDIGSGEGKTMAAALAEGASSVQGFELPQNKANNLIYEAAMKRIERKFHSRLLPRSTMTFMNIEKVLSFHVIAKYDSNPFLFRSIAYRRAPKLFTVSGMECRTLRKFTSWSFVPAAIPWTS